MNIKLIGDAMQRGHGRRRLAVLALGLFLITFVLTPRQTALSQENPTNIDITSAAIQTFYLDGVPHTDVDGNPLDAFSFGRSLFPNGMYFVTPCRVSEEFAWDAFDGTAPVDWDGRYRLSVNFGSALDLRYDRRLAFDKVVDATTAQATRLPAGTDLYYSVRLAGTDQVIAEGPFTSAACPSAAEADPVATLADAGFNFAIAINEPDTLALLSQAEGTGFKIVAPGPTWSDDLFDMLKANPAVYGWYMADEPLIQARILGIDPGLMYMGLNNLYNTFAPQTNQVFFLTEGSNFVTDPWGPAFIQLGDAGAHDNYLKYGSDALTTIRPLASTVARQTVYLAEAKPSWVAVQTFGSSSMPGWDYPTPQEAQATVYAAIIHGATGIINFVWNSDIVGGIGLGPAQPVETVPDDVVAKRLALWNAYASPEDGINKQLRELTPVILSPTSRKAYGVFVDQTPNSQAPIRTMLKEFWDSYYLLAVNIDSAPIDASLAFWMPPLNVDALFEQDPSFNVSGNFLTDHFEPFGVHVYRFDRPCSEIVIPTLDVNNDGRTNLVDLTVITQLPLRIAQRSYSAAYDLNRDGKLSIGDTTLLSRRYAKIGLKYPTCP